jgi:hypothetical protein
MFVLIYENVLYTSAIGLYLCSVDRLLQDMTNDTLQKKVNLQASTHTWSETRKANVKDGVAWVVNAATTVLCGPMCLVLTEQQ